MTHHNPDTPPPFQTLILAAGRGTRLHSKTSKLMHPILGKPILGHVVTNAQALNTARIIAILGHQSEPIQDYLTQQFPNKVHFAYQTRLKGTGDAVWAAKDFLTQDAPPFTLILSGDVPNLQPASLQPFLDHFFSSQCLIGVLTTKVQDPTGYGRIIRHPDGTIQKIVEEKDATSEEKHIQEINTGTYIVQTQFLHDTLKHYCASPPNNAQNEWYLTHVLEVAANTTHTENTENTENTTSTIKETQKSSGMQKTRNKNGQLLEDEGNCHKTTTNISADAQSGEINAQDAHVNTSKPKETADTANTTDTDDSPDTADTKKSKDSKLSGIFGHKLLRPEEAQGVNTRVQLSQATAFARQEVNHRHMLQGVTLMDPQTTFIDTTVVIEKDVTLGPQVQLQGQSHIAEDCVIEAGCILNNVTLGPGTWIKPYTIISNSTLGDHCTLGPFAHIRPGTTLKDSCKIGNFVEVKKAEFGEGAKASHLSYIGDAKIGDGVNIGAGTITCNYDGVFKHETHIESGAFIGSNTSLVAPVQIGANAIVGAGSTITHDVPPDALGLERAQQENRPDWARRKRDLLNAMKQQEHE